MKHAPVADYLERLVLIAMADAADSDGCNSFRSISTLMNIATGADKRTIIRRQKSLEERGLIRRDTSKAPARYLAIPADKRPVRWEICIPVSWWSDPQLMEIQRERVEHGLLPLTAAGRPDLGAAPVKAVRADKGKACPKRKNAKSLDADSERGVLETLAVDNERGVLKTPGGVSSRHLAGCLQDTQPSPFTFPNNPPSIQGLPVNSLDEHLEARMDGGNFSTKEEQEDSPAAGARSAAESLVASLPPVKGAHAGASLVGLVEARLVEGWSVEALRCELTRDLATARNAGVYYSRMNGLLGAPAPLPVVAPSQARRCPVHPGTTSWPCSSCLGDLKAGEDPFQGREDLRPDGWFEAHPLAARLLERSLVEAVEAVAEPEDVWVSPVFDAESGDWVTEGNAGGDSVESTSCTNPMCHGGYIYLGASGRRPCRVCGGPVAVGKPASVADVLGSFADSFGASI